MAKCKRKVLNFVRKLEKAETKSKAAWLKYKNHKSISDARIKNFSPVFSNFN